MSQTNVSVTLAAFDVPSILVEECKSLSSIIKKSSRGFKMPPIGPGLLTASPPPFNPSEWHAPIVAPREFLLSEVEPHILLQMCEAYRYEVFKRAGKSDWLLNVPREEDNSKETVSMSQEDHKLYLIARIKQVEIADEYGFSLPEDPFVINVKKNASSDAEKQAEARAKERAVWVAGVGRAQLATESAR